MFSPIQIQQQKRQTSSLSKTPQPKRSSNNSSLRDLRSPINVSSLAVHRLRQLVKEHTSDSNEGVIVTENDDYSSRNNNVASDLSALLGGAPIAKVFLHIDQSNRRNEEVVEESSSNQNVSSLSQVSPIRKQRTNNSNNKPLVLGKQKAKNLDDELSLKMKIDNNKQSASISTGDASNNSNKNANNNNNSDSSSMANIKSSITPLSVVMNCREVGFKVADNLLKGNASSLLKKIIEILINYGEEQQTQNDELRAKITNLQNQLYEFTDARNEIEAKKKKDEDRRRENRKAASLEGLQEKYDALFVKKKRENSTRVPDDIEEEHDAEAAAIEEEEERTLPEEAKSRKRMIKQIVQIQAELATEKEAVEQLETAKRDLKKRLDDQVKEQARREDEQRELMMKNSERYDDMQERYNEKSAEIAGLKNEVKELQSELDDKLWQGTIESESTDVAMSMLRKHSKDTESRCAMTMMRLRQEQELVTKLKRKLNDLSATFNGCVQDLESMKRKQQVEGEQQQHRGEHDGEDNASATSPTTTSAAAVDSPGSSKQPSPMRRSNSGEQQQQQQNSNVQQQPTIALSHSLSSTSSSTFFLDSAVQLMHSVAKQVEEIINSSNNPTGELSGGGAVISSVTTPRPDKEMIVRNVPTLGKAQANASTAALMEALMSIIKSQDERLKGESRSWRQAQEAADKVLNDRKNRVFVDCEMQTM